MSFKFGIVWIAFIIILTFFTKVVILNFHIFLYFATIFIMSIIIFFQKKPALYLYGSLFLWLIVFWSLIFFFFNFFFVKFVVWVVMYCLVEFIFELINIDFVLFLTNVTHTFQKWF